MSFRYYSNTISQMSRNAAAGIFVVGLLLIGLGFLIWILRDLFAILFSILFCVFGIGCFVTSVKILWKFRKLKRHTGDDTDAYRRNVRIHTEEDLDL